MLIEQFHNRTVKIEDFQTTYIILAIDNNMFRFDFKNKKESIIKKKENGILTLYREHPLLINHNETYINSAPEKIDLFVDDIQKSIEESLKGWRHWKDYIKIKTGIDEQIFLQNIQKGSGKLLNAPFSVLEKLEKVCSKHHVLIRHFGDKIIKPHQLLMINNQFVIAEDFIFRNT
ncbi:hypothetical protein [Chryseobacterium sp. SIMBA_029]|uniref:hypothetical protein n=1 Tax=Chryseobacterium sp. SIMBA_029 TaxID=3085772 RepID=UPI0039797250